MKAEISRLYAHIILFFQKAVKWYNMGSARRAISSILHPFELEYQDTVEEIRLCSQTVDDIANAAGRAELRDVHITIQTLQQQLLERDKRLHEMQRQQNEIHEKMAKFDIRATCLLQIATSE